MAPRTVLVLSHVDPAPGPDATLATRMCAAIRSMPLTPPLLIVAHGDLALLLPAVALSQRSLHRAVDGYLLVDPELPPVTDSWPDAPVTVATYDPWVETQARLRSWELVDHDQVEALIAE